MTTQAGAAFELRGVSKRYRFFALEDLSLRLEPGQILGLVGPNGAGKSTTIRILMGLVSPDAGEVELLGCRMQAEQVQAKRHVGFVSEEMRLFGGATLGGRSVPRPTTPPAPAISMRGCSMWKGMPSRSLRLRECRCLLAWPGLSEARRQHRSSDDLRLSGGAACVGSPRLLMIPHPRPLSQRTGRGEGSQ